MTLSEQHDQDRKHKEDVHGEHDGERVMYERKPTGVSHSCDVQPDGVSSALRELRDDVQRSSSSTDGGNEKGDGVDVCASMETGHCTISFPPKCSSSSSSEQDRNHGTAGMNSSASKTIS